jgi:hypothetical protein
MRDELYCSNCGNDSKKTFNYIRTVANGSLLVCKRCKTENLVREKLMRTTTNITANVLRLCAGGSKPNL